MATQPAQKFQVSSQEYLAIERKSEQKSEYWNGEMFAMAGASRSHNVIVLNIGSELRIQLKGRPCEVYLSDMRVKIPSAHSYMYPDIVVVCGQPEFEDNQSDTLLNPTVIIEVLSPSTADYDRGAKFGRYRKLDSLKEYVLVSQEQPFIEHFVRQSETIFWLFSEVNELAATVELPSINCRLLLTEVYDKIIF